MTVRRRKSPEQIVRLLGQADRILANGGDIAAACRELGISESSYYRWRERYGGMDVDDAKRLKELEKENATDLPPCVRSDLIGSQSVVVQVQCEAYSAGVW